MNDNIVLIIALVLIGVSIIFKIYDFRKEKVKQFVKASSMRYLECQKLNREYSGYFLSYQSEYNHCVQMNSRHKVDAFDFYQELGNLLSSSHRIDLDYVENCVSSNQHWYMLYMFAYNHLSEYRTEEQFRLIPGKKPHMSYKEYANEERKLVFPMLHPELSFRVIITASYTSPKGKSHYNQSKTFSIQDCRKCLIEKARWAQERDCRDEERKKMTTALRYEVLRRDGFRCTICGRGNVDGVKLHVDHIQPVSKGGKTELSNLRTLCQDCNLGKSDRWDPGGIN